MITDSRASEIQDDPAGSTLAEVVALAVGVLELRDDLAMATQDLEQARRGLADLAADYAQVTVRQQARIGQLRADLAKAVDVATEHARAADHAADVAGKAEAEAEALRADLRAARYDLAQVQAEADQAKAELDTARRDLDQWKAEVGAAGMVARLRALEDAQARALEALTGSSAPWTT